MIVRIRRGRSYKNGKVVCYSTYRLHSLWDIEKFCKLIRGEEEENIVFQFCAYFWVVYFIDRNIFQSIQFVSALALQTKFNNNII